MTPFPDHWRRYELVCKQPELSHFEKAVLQVLMHHVNEGWISYPSIDLIMRETSLSRATVERTLPNLVGKGVISKAAAGRGRVVRYRVHGDVLESRLPPEEPTSTGGTTYLPQMGAEGNPPTSPGGTTDLQQRYPPTSDRGTPYLQQRGEVPPAEVQNGSENGSGNDPVERSTNGSPPASESTADPKAALAAIADAARQESEGAEEDAKAKREARKAARLAREPAGAPAPAERVDPAQKPAEELTPKDFETLFRRAYERKFPGAPAALWHEKGEFKILRQLLESYEADVVRRLLVGTCERWEEVSRALKLTGCPNLQLVWGYRNSLAPIVLAGHRDVRGRAEYTGQKDSDDPAAKAERIAKMKAAVAETERRRQEKLAAEAAKKSEVST